MVFSLQLSTCLIQGILREACNGTQHPVCLGSEIWSEAVNANTCTPLLYRSVFAAAGAIADRMKAHQLIAVAPEVLGRDALTPPKDDYGFVPNSAECIKRHVQICPEMDALNHTFYGTSPAPPSRV